MPRTKAKDQIFLVQVGIDKPAYYTITAKSAARAALQCAFFLRLRGDMVGWPERVWREMPGTVPSPKTAAAGRLFAKVITITDDETSLQKAGALSL